MNKYYILFLIGIMITLRVYPQNSDNYTLLELSPDIENEGLELLYTFTNINENIGIIKSGWVDLVGDNRKTEFYINFYVEETQRYYNIIISKRFPEIIYYFSWQASNEKYNITFFRRNDNPYIIIDYRGGSGRYYVFSIFEYNYRSSMFGNMKIIYEEELGFGGWFEIIDGKIIFYKDGNKYQLDYKNEEYELVKLG